MTIATASINQTQCLVRQLRYCQASVLCDRCQGEAGYYSTAGRTAIDLDLARPVLLRVTVSVHYCARCQHYLRAQPPFLRPDGIYANEVVRKAVSSVYEDGMAMRRATARLARDFWVRPSEASIRFWCKEYAAGFDFVTQYQPWVVQEFSGVLCVDEVYQDKLALLLAVDPAARAAGDQLVGYQLVHGTVTAVEVKNFLVRLQAAGIEPQQVITDASALYPTVLAQVWPQAAHQLCLFHETRRIVQAAMKAVHAVRRNLPKAPPAPVLHVGGRLCDKPPSSDETDAASQRWYWRQIHRCEQIAEVHALAQQGLSQRAISQQTGHHRATIKQWLAQAIPALPADTPTSRSDIAALPGPQQRREQRRRLLARVQALVEEGLSDSAIARQTGIHRLTVKKWAACPPPWAEEEPTPAKPETEISPPTGWSTWEEVRHVREALQKHRFLLMRRPDHLNGEEQAQIDELLASPIGDELRVIRNFVVGWFQLLYNEHGQRRTVDDARSSFIAWQTNPSYASNPQLQRIVEAMTIEKFAQLSHFLCNPGWEATNNGAERTARTFRHRQAAHFNLRSVDAIDAAVGIAAHLQHEMRRQPQPQPFHTCQRGRHKRKNSTDNLPTVLAEIAYSPVQDP